MHPLILFTVVASSFYYASAQSTQPIQCYQCASLEKPECAESDVSKLKAFKKSCPKLTNGAYAGSSAIGCRKILQKVEGEDSTIRECAYSGKTVDGGKKTGNWAVQLHYYQCVNENPNEPCNGASFVYLSPILIFASLVLTTLWH